MARRKTAKELGQRHDFNYFKSWTPMRRLRVGLSIGIPLVVALWLITSGVKGDALPYSSGPLSVQHNFIGTNCQACHSVQKPLIGRLKFSKHASDEACQRCHSTPQHQAREAFTPGCATCHTEHEGRTSLAHVDDKDCVQCHSSLKTRSGPPRFDTAILSFKRQHPEFAPVRLAVDPTGIKLNHAVHLKAGLLGPHGNPVQMECGDCHRAPADSTEPWPYAIAGYEPQLQAAPLHQPKAAENVVPAAGRAFMAPVSFAKQCAACHQLQFDRHFDIVVPHDKPEVVREFVIEKFRDYIRDHPGAIRESVTLDRRIPGLTQTAVVARNADEWVQLRTAEAELLLWRKTCKQCHTFDVTPDRAVPTVRPANQPARWFEHARFSHYAHQGLDCTACHAKARSSKESADVLLPGIQTCRQCHRGDASQAGSAESGCFLCHQYHDWKQAKTRVKGTYTIPQLSSENQPTR
jgi:hypothetical protein